MACFRPRDGVARSQSLDASLDDQMKEDCTKLSGR
jgi:hypothetical protein